MDYLPKLIQEAEPGFGPESPLRYFPISTALKPLKWSEHILEVFIVDEFSTIISSLDIHNPLGS